MGLQGVQGPAGPQGPAGTGLTVLDANGRSLGVVLEVNRSEVVFYTSTGHLVELQWDGTIADGQIFYSGTSCTGNAFLNAAPGNGRPLFGKWVTRSRTTNSLMVPANPTNGAAASVSLNSVSMDNPTCRAEQGSRQGYQLTSITAANVGLPTYPVAAPLRLQ